ncbi:MAG: substrate-binding domain-containing protein [Propionibacteriaceae bacterium]|jgi:DNA-binding LacI/PurR family transcriptional regulator|nr:substrate-binding domain-containing protein [Propionibacteriaceae bacterium]
MTPAGRELPDQRRAVILSALVRNGSGRIADLARTLNVTPTTVRRDLALLEAEGLIERLHGGAKAIVGPESPTGIEGVPAGTTGWTGRPGARLAMFVPALDFYWPTVARSAEATARQHGLQFLLRGGSYESVDERPTLRPIYDSPDCVGVITAPNTDSPQADEVLEWIEAQATPSVLVERQASLASTGLPLESVTTDFPLGAAMAVRHLLALGHRRLALVSTPTSPHAAGIASGFSRTCAEQGLAAKRAPVFDIPDNRQTGFTAALEDVIDRLTSAGVTGLLVHSDREAMSLAQQLEARGLAVPQDISLVAYDDEVASLFSPALTAIRPAREAIGRTAVDLLLARLADPGRTVHRVVVSPELFVRDSTAPPQA